MNQSTSLERNTKIIERDQWVRFLERFTRENRGARASMEVLASDVGEPVDTGDRPFDRVAADVKDGENVVWITLGSTADDHLTRSVHNVTVIRALPLTDQQGAVLEIEADDGGKTVLELSQPDPFALPPATARQCHSSPGSPPGGSEN
jgi:hypothetical protein